MDTLQLAVADNLGIGVVDLQGAEQGDEGCLLGRGTGVGGTALLIEAALVADADGVSVVVAGMGTDLLFWTALVELTVAGDVVVVAAAFPAAGLVHLVELLHGNVLVRSRCRAVKDN